MLIILFLSGPVIAEPALRINEVMFNPEGDDNNREFIEIFSADILPDISSYIIADSESNDTLQKLQFAESNYALIVEEGFDIAFANISNSSVYSAGATIGNNLGNNFDEIKIYGSGGILIANISYNCSVILCEEGKSLEFNGDNGMFSAGILGGSPGTENPLQQNTNISLNISLNQTNISNNNTNNNISNNPVNITTNTTVNITNDIFSSCDIDFEIITSSNVYQNKERIEYLFSAGRNITGYSIDYWIESLDETVRAKKTTKNMNPKYFTPSTDDSEVILFLKAELIFDECIFNAEKMIVVQNPDAELETEISKTEKKAKSTKSSLGSSSVPKAAEKNVVKKIEYTVENLNSLYQTGKFGFSLKISNEAVQHGFEVWSYVYNGTKCISCRESNSREENNREENSREQNKQAFSVGSGETKIINLENIVLKQGSYKLKIKIRKDGQSSTTDITRNITFFGQGISNATTEINVSQSSFNSSSETSLTSLNAQKINPQLKEFAANPEPGSNTGISTSNAGDKPGSRVIYESKSSRLKTFIPLFVLAALMLAVVYFIWTG